MNETIYYECNEENYKFILNELHSKDKEIKRLNNEIKRQENVITELNDDNEYLTDNINSLEVENTRLNNIITSFKKQLEKQQIELNIDISPEGNVEIEEMRVKSNE